MLRRFDPRVIYPEGGTSCEDRGVQCNDLFESHWGEVRGAAGRDQGRPGTTETVGSMHRVHQMTKG